MRRKILWGGLIAIFLIVAGGTIFLNIWIDRYLRSDAFRTTVEEKTGFALKLKASFEPFRWTGMSVYSDRFIGVADASNISAQRVRAGFNLRAILTGAWQLNDLDIGRLDTVFGTPTQNPVPAAKPEFVIPVKKPAAWTAFLPQRFEVERVVVGDGNFSWGSGGLGTGAVQGTAITATPGSNGWNINAKNGKLLMKQFPDLLIDSAKLRSQRGTFYISDAQMRTADNGAVQASGERDSDGALQLKIQWQKVLVQSLLQDPWNTHLTGLLQGTANLQSRADAPPIIDGDFTLTEGLLQGIPLQEKIATFTRVPEYQRLPIQQLSGNYHIQAGSIAFTNLVLESKGLLRVEGTCLIQKDGSLGGTLRVGVTSQSLQWLPGSQARVFTVSKNGYLWTDVQLSGTIQNPRENLSARLLTAATGEIIDTGINAGKSLLQSPSNAEDTIKKAQGILKQLVPLP
ncbi:MAG: hypothetical protein ABIP97_02785 [Chthoniobacterales bacterium]